MSERIATAALIATLLLSGAIAWWFQLRPELRFDAQQLEELPLVSGAWAGESIPLESAVENLLRADVNLQRAYHGPDDAILWLYVGYYGTARGGRPEHTPDVCYPSAGWRITDRAVWSEGAARANEYIVEQDGHRRLVHFWYQSSESTGLLGTWDVSVDQLRTRLASGRADGALVRLSTPIAGDGIEDARRRLVDFQRPLARELSARWPDETSVD